MHRIQENKKRKPLENLERISEDILVCHKIEKQDKETKVMNRFNETKMPVHGPYHLVFAFS